jgi:hypothetical protein
MIVARHEVPGVMRKTAPSSGTVEPGLTDLDLDWTPTYLEMGIPGVSKAA